MININHSSDEVGKIATAVDYLGGNTTSLVKTLSPIVPAVGLTLSAGKAGYRFQLAYKAFRTDGYRSPSLYLNAASGILASTSCVLGSASHVAERLAPGYSLPLYSGSAFCSSLSDAIDEKFDFLKSFIC